MTNDVGGVQFVKDLLERFKCLRFSDVFNVSVVSG